MIVVAFACKWAIRRGTDSTKQVGIDIVLNKIHWLENIGRKNVSLNANSSRALMLIMVGTEIAEHEEQATGRFPNRIAAADAYSRGGWNRRSLSFLSCQVVSN